MREKNILLKKLPAVDQIMDSKRVRELTAVYPKEVVADSVRETIETERERLLRITNTSDCDGLIINEEEIKSKIISDAIFKIENKFKPNLRRIINATGTVLHTNLGRAILPEKVYKYLADILMHYSSLEYDIEKGVRGSRYSHVESLLCSITGAESALVVNNNAGAVLLVMSALASGKEVIISRGQLVEIGGSFRIPDVLSQSGAKLVEVGTTNKTYIRDYEEKINQETGALLKVHTSNYAICGFTVDVKSESLVALGGKYNLPVIEDLGSGTLIDFSVYGLSKEPTVQQSIKAGLDVVTFSGDKLLGGPQAGIIIGKLKYIEKIKKHPLTRALRTDKITLGMLEYVLRLYLDESIAKEEIPTLKMILCSLDVLTNKAEELYKNIKRKHFGINVEITDTKAIVGGGAFPVEQLPSKGVSISIPGISAATLEKMLRHSMIPIIGRIENNKLIFDVRTIQQDEIEIVAETLKNIYNNTNDNVPGGYDL